MAVVIVTGGTYGIGAGISLTLASRGHDVIAFGLDSRQPSSIAENGTVALREEAHSLGLTVTTMEADVSKDCRRTARRRRDAGDGSAGSTRS